MQTKGKEHVKLNTKHTVPYNKGVLNRFSHENLEEAIKRVQQELKQPIFYQRSIEEMFYNTIIKDDLSTHEVKQAIKRRDITKKDIEDTQEAYRAQL